MIRFRHFIKLAPDEREALTRRRSTTDLEKKKLFGFNEPGFITGGKDQSPIRS